MTSRTIFRACVVPVLYNIGVLAIGLLAAMQQEMKVVVYGH